MNEAAADVVGLYRRHSGAWTTARNNMALSERVWLARFAELLPPEATVLDIGCGSGQPIARHLHDSGFHVTGVDSAPEMIALFRAELPAAAAEVSDMRALNLGRRFDGLIAWGGFFHLSPHDQRLMFPVFRDHAKPGTVLIFTSGPAFGEVVGTFESEPLYHASLDPDEYRLLLDQNGFEVTAHVAEDPDCDGHTVWLPRHRSPADAI